MNPHPGPLILDHSSWTAHPGAHIFPVPGPALFGHTRYRSSIPAALWLILDSVRRCGGSWTTHPVRWIPHPGGSLIRWTIHPWTSWTRTGTPHPAHPVRWILDYPGTSWPAGHPGLSRWIPMDPDGSSSHGQGILMHPMGRASDGPMDIFVYTTSPLPHRFGPRLMGRGGLGVCVQIIQKGPSAFEVPPNS